MSARHDDNAVEQVSQKKLKIDSRSTDDEDEGLEHVWAEPDDKRPEPPFNRRQERVLNTTKGKVLDSIPGLKDLPKDVWIEAEGWGVNGIVRLFGSVVDSAYEVVRDFGITDSMHGINQATKPGVRFSHYSGDAGVADLPGVPTAIEAAVHDEGPQVVVDYEQSRDTARGRIGRAVFDVGTGDCQYAQLFKRPRDSDKVDSLSEELDGEYLFLNQPEDYDGPGVPESYDFSGISVIVPGEGHNGFSEVYVATGLNPDEVDYDGEDVSVNPYSDTKVVRVGYRDDDGVALLQEETFDASEVDDALEGEGFGDLGHHDLAMR